TRALRPRVCVGGRVRIAVVHDLQSARARRYLLGEASEEERSAIEREYFEDRERLDAIAAIEDDLIEDYLEGQLPSDERRHFERVYLAAPHHRQRVETIRRVMAASSSGLRSTNTQSSTWPTGPSSGRFRRQRRWYIPAAAAAIVVLAVGAIWMRGAFLHRAETAVGSTSSTAGTPTPGPSAERPPDQSPAAIPPPAHIVALSLSPATVRSATDSPVLVIPAGTDMVALQLEGDLNIRPFPAARVVIRTVAGASIWEGA